MFVRICRNGNTLVFKGPKDNTNYYIACQAPMENTINDFWRMIWEQNSKVIIMATDLSESGVEKCAEYLPPSVVLDNNRTFGDFQVTTTNNLTCIISYKILLNRYS